MANIANPYRGEVELVVQNPDGEIERTYILKLSVNASIALQKKHKKNMAQIVAGINELDFESIRDIAFMLLQKHHADVIKTPEQAGDVIDDAGGFDKFFEAFQSLTAANQPPKDLVADTATEKSGAVNPPTAQSTMGSSTSTPAVPV